MSIAAAKSLVLVSSAARMRRMVRPMRAALATLETADERGIDAESFGKLFLGHPRTLAQST